MISHACPAIDDPVGQPRGWKGDCVTSRQFFGTHDVKLDSKNRLSIPAGFRTVMRSVEAQKLVLRPSFRFPAIEAWPDVYFAEFEAKLESREVFSDEHDDMAWDIYAGASEAEPDKDGRVILGGDLIAWAGLTDQVAVVGLGKRFEIWERTAGKERSAQRIRQRRMESVPAPGSSA